MKKLIVYYSYSGNTKKIANYMAQKLEADVLEIKPIIPYSNNYDEVVENAKAEIRNEYKPEIENLDVSKYSTIILGTPVWWYTFAPAVRTFLTTNNLNNKTIYPFATNGGWLGHTFEDIKNICANSNVKNGLNIEFNGSNLITSKAQIDAWINSVED